MKKIMIALSAIAMAIGVQAATVSWGSGALYTASSATGGWSTTLVSATAPQSVVTMSVYLVSDTTYNTLTAAGKTAADLYNWAGEQAAATYSAQNKNPATSAIIPAATVNVVDELSASTTYYSIIVAEYTDATYGEMYMAAAKTVTTTAAGAGSAQNIFGGAGTAATGGVRNWTAVPEPTSGLLLLVGGALLALKRRRA